MGELLNAAAPRFRTDGLFAPELLAPNGVVGLPNGVEGLRMFLALRPLLANSGEEDICIELFLTGVDPRDRSMAAFAPRLPSDGEGKVDCH